ncbi:hypothetical protein GOP47_0007330 [Adiantum capillus-veneris]|uniref:Cytochrome P450 n=1 Tax=Adiantum capillus-veneris TaxID=13818 RepID=A0A9D4V0H1_ADICA|nr:hypothetical protein GOP47_0007330 [Adiantum capillus-veneris]
MELPSAISGVVPLVVLAAALIASLLRLCGNSASRRPAAQWPPGPPAWPVIGHLHLLGDLPHQSLWKLSQSYGPLMGLRLGGVCTIVASTAEMAKQILHTHDLAFANHPRKAASVHMLLDADMVSAPYGSSTLRRMRQLCNLELLNVKLVAALRHVREEEVRNLARAVLEAGRRGEEKVELRPRLRATTNDIICRMMMGKKIEDVSSKSGKGQLELLNLVEDVHYLMGVFYVGDFIPWLSWLDPNRYLKRMKAGGRQAQILLQEIIDKRRRQKRNADEEDFLDILLATNAEHTMSDDNVIGLILDMFTAGSHTGATAAEWVLADLLNNPTKMHKAQDEIENVVGKSSFVKEEDLKSLPYLRMVVKESMRLHPVGPLLLPREASQECQIKGYKIPAKTCAFINVWAIGRDPSTWENPLQFWPERFDRKEVDFRGFTWTMDIPSNVKILGSSKQVVDMSEAGGLVLDMAIPLCPFATPRLPLNLY